MSQFTATYVGNITRALRQQGYRFVAIEVGNEAITYFLDADRTSEELEKLRSDDFFASMNRK